MKKQNWKRPLLGLLASIFITTSSIGHVQANSNIPIIIDNQEFPTYSIHKNERVLVRSTLFRSIGLNISWNGEKNAVILTDSNIQLTLPVGHSYAYTVNKKDATKFATPLSVTAINNKEGTYVPLRVVAETFGMTVSFDAAAKTILIDSKKNIVLDVAQNDMRWFYNIVEAEASGEGYQGKLAVAATVLNRVERADFPNTIKDVIFQVVHKNGVDHYQFTPVKNGKIYDISPSKETIQAVNDALNGIDPTNNAVVFYNPRLTDDRWVRSLSVTKTIGNHVFAK